LELDLFALLFLAGAGFLAAFLDAIAGGGGLISLPALLSVGIPPIAALATNKMQSVVGTTVAAITYWRRGYIKFKELIVPIILTFVGSLFGAATAKSLDTNFLTLLVPILLIGVSLYFMLSPKMTDDARAERLKFAIFAPVMGHDCRSNRWWLFGSANWNVLWRKTHQAANCGDFYGHGHSVAMADCFSRLTGFCRLKMFMVNAVLSMFFNTRV
jgi:uncharacterized membrane protein YfcA